MARVISDILDADTLHFNHLIEKWEHRTGRHGHDLKLYSDMRTQAVSAIKDLGLDPTDTVSGELYFALQERARQDDEWLAEILKISKSDDPKRVVEKSVKWVSKNAESLDIWVLKTSFARSFLKISE